MVVGSRLANPPTLPNQDLTQGLGVEHGVKLYFTTKRHRKTQGLSVKHGVKLYFTTITPICGGSMVIQCATSGDFGATFAKQKNHRHNGHLIF